jgi:hypothetical protein
MTATGAMQLLAGWPSYVRLPTTVVYRSEPFLPTKTGRLLLRTPGRMLIQTVKTAVLMYGCPTGTYRKPSLPSTWSTVSPPIRGRGRPLSVTTTATTISSRRGASGTRISMASK